MSIVKLPKYGPGDVIDLNYKMLSTLPNRVYIKAVYFKETDTEWMYQVISESTGCDIITMNESFISDRQSKKTAKVYNTDIVKKLMGENYRFCGNFPSYIAIRKAEKIAIIDTVDSIMLYPALGPNGDYVKGDNLGIWIRFAKIIRDDGKIIASDKKDYGYPIIMK